MIQVSKSWSHILPRPTSCSTDAAKEKPSLEDTILGQRRSIPRCNCTGHMTRSMCKLKILNTWFRLFFCLLEEFFVKRITITVLLTDSYLGSHTKCRINISIDNFLMVMTFCWKSPVILKSDIFSPFDRFMVAEALIHTYVFLSGESFAWDI